MCTWPLALPNFLWVEEGFLCVDISVMTLIECKAPDFSLGYIHKNRLYDFSKMSSWLRNSSEGRISSTRVALDCHFDFDTEAR